MCPHIDDWKYLITIKVPYRSLELIVYKLRYLRIALQNPTTKGASSSGGE